jgi:dextranase
MFADQEKRSAVSLVMISGAPLIMADQYDTIGQAAWVYQNSELLDLRRQGLVAKPFSFDPKNADSMRWKGQLPDGSWVVGLFNRDDGNVTRSIDFAADLGISGNATIHDLWTHQDIGAGTSYSASIGKHDVKLLRIIPGGPTATPAPRTPTTTATPGTPTVTPPPGNADIVRTEKVLAGISADKSRYAPGSSVTFTVNVLNSTGSAINGGAVTLYFRSRETSLASPISQPLSVGNGSSATLTFRWTAPQLDFTGYLVSAVATDSAGNPLDLINTAVDVSSSWVKFPRYGYMTNNTFGIQNLSAAQAQSIMNTMTKYHIDGLQFYDWMYNHHQPLCGTVSNPCSSWISDGNQRTVYASSLKNLINAAHANNIMAMPYNAIFSADNGTCCGAPNYRTDGSGVDPAWGIYQDANHQKPLAFFQWDYMDPSNPNWQRHLMDQTLMANQAFGFDGFHGDTFGDPNVVAYKYDGTPAGVATNPCTTDTTNADSGIPVNNVAGSPTWINGTFPPFLNYAKQRLGNAYLMFNPVSYAHAHCEANSSPSDILYTELWPNEQDHYWDYNTIKDAIDIAFAESKPHSADGQGKSMIVAAYSNFREGGGGSHNTPSVLLLNATMFASGGGHIELGDTGLMLNYQEYRAGATPMSSELTQAMVNYYDFMTGYQNLLRNGQENTSRTVTVQGQTTSSKAAPNSVWAFTKADSKYEILHLINLVGESSIYWQTGNCDRCTHLAPLHPAPTTLTNVTVKYYNAKPVNGVLFASPDYNGGMTYSVPFTKGSDSGGEFVSFTLPSLQYWDMVYMSQTGPGDAPQLPGTPRTPTPTVTPTPVTPTPVTPTPVTPTPVTPTATPNNQNLVTNGGFETGTIQGWTEWHPGGQSAKYGVDGNDVHSGAKKLWFWNASGYQQSVHQVKTGLPNGSYTVRAWIKQNTGTPNIARMEVAGYGGSTVYVNVPKGNSYNLYSATVNVTNGQIDIGFYIYATGGDANLQIDDVELVKN